MIIQNPGYAGRRPRHFAEIDILRPVAQPQAIADVEAGRADASNLIPGQSGIARIEREYGQEKWPAVERLIEDEIAGESPDPSLARVLGRVIRRER